MNLKTLISNNLQGKKVLLFFLLASIIYFVMLFYTIPKLNTYADGLQIFDMKPNGYDLGYAQELLNKLGKKGRAFYLFRQIPLDLVYPIVFAISNTLILSFFLKKINRLENWYLLTILPILGGIFDELENLGVIYMIKSYNSLSEIIVKIISIFTVAKSLITTLYFLILLLVFAILIFKKIK